MSDNKKDFKFDKRAAAYDDRFEGKFLQRFYGVLLSYLDLKQSDTVIDVGCDTGYLLHRIAEYLNCSRWRASFLLHKKWWLILDASGLSLTVLSARALCRL